MCVVRDMKLNRDIGVVGSVGKIIDGHRLLPDDAVMGPVVLTTDGVPPKDALKSKLDRAVADDRAADLNRPGQIAAGHRGRTMQPEPRFSEFHSPPRSIDRPQEHHQSQWNQKGRRVKLRVRSD